MGARLTFERLLAKASPCPNTGCWFWADKSSNGRGYGRPKYQGKSHQAHRLFYTLLVGPIPEGLELDHKCRVTWCVNPDHLEPVKHRVNVLRGRLGIVQAERGRARTHCLRGHPLEGDNVRWYQGRRACWTCLRTIHYRKRPSGWARQRAAAVVAQQSRKRKP